MHILYIYVVYIYFLFIFPQKYNLILLSRFLHFSRFSTTYLILAKRLLCFYLSFCFVCVSLLNIFCTIFQKYLQIRFFFRIFVG